MKTYIYNFELIEFKISILEELKKELLLTKDFKIRKNSKAYNEIDKIILSLNVKIDGLSSELSNSIKEDIFSTIKLETSTLESLFELKDELDIDSVAELLKLLVMTYKEYFIFDKLTKINHVNLNRNLEHELNKTNFYICTKADNLKNKILYKLDDIKIYENIEYINFDEFKEYIMGNEVFYISCRFTLQEIDKFIAIWKSY